MKAVNNAGVITFYQSVPNSFRSSTGLHLNVKEWSEDEMENNGLFNVMIDDSYDSRIHDLGEIYWDTEATCFKKDISNKTFSKSLSELKEQSISNFKAQIGSELSKTDWYIIRKADNGTEVPQEIADAREDLRELSDTTETEINALSAKGAVITFDFPTI
tara:strand:- start:228 stop:707 length:480 start_codon:yes stop_codon:yes gene_type:complete